MEAIDPHGGPHTVGEPGRESKPKDSRRFRITVRLLMALPVLLALGFFAADRISGEDWITSGTEPVEFRVVDVATGRPIAGASVALDGGPEPRERPTGSEGAVAFAVRYVFRGSDTLLRRTRSPGIPWTATVSAPGYDLATTRLDDHRPGAGDDFRTTRPIVIRLRPARGSLTPLPPLPRMSVALPKG